MGNGANAIAPPPPLKDPGQTLSFLGRASSVRPNADNEIRKRKYRNGVTKSIKDGGCTKSHVLRAVQGSNEYQVRQIICTDDLCIPSSE